MRFDINIEGDYMTALSHYSLRQMAAHLERLDIVRTIDVALKKFKMENNFHTVERTVNTMMNALFQDDYRHTLNHHNAPTYPFECPRVNWDIDSSILNTISEWHSELHDAYRKQYLMDDPAFLADGNIDDLLPRTQKAYGAWMDWNGIIICWLARYAGKRNAVQRDTIAALVEKAVGGDSVQ